MNLLSCREIASVDWIGFHVVSDHLVEGCNPCHQSLINNKDICWYLDPPIKRSQHRVARLCRNQWISMAKCHLISSSHLFVTQPFGIIRIETTSVRITNKNASHHFYTNLIFCQNLNFIQNFILRLYLTVHKDSVKKLISMNIKDF